MTIERTAHAKINLCLHVTGQRADGYHLLDSLVVFAECGDQLRFEPANSLSLSISGPFADGLDTENDNLILKAARCFNTQKGARIHLEKALPIAAGIGGGSADAAAALSGLTDLWMLPFPDQEAQLRLGADVPVCVSGQAVRMSGIGEVLTPFSSIPQLPILLVNPGVSVSTPVIFNGLQSKSNAPIAGKPDQDLLGWLKAQRNDLEPPAIKQAPVIAEVLAALAQNGAGLARMSGSGATCFGIFDTMSQAATAGAAIAQAQPDWWVQTTRLTT